jgi:hypothetical protein
MKEVVLATRYPVETVKRIDAHVKRLAAEAPVGVKLTRADAIRNLITKALDVAEGSKKC